MRRANGGHLRPPHPAVTNGRVQENDRIAVANNLRSQQGAAGFDLMRESHSG
ncbi:MAG: hypothetical protein ACN6PR_13185 [Achromobacter sp.]